RSAASTYALSLHDALPISAGGRTGGPGFRLVRQENRGKAAALNHGLLLATTEVAVVIDADTVVTPGLLAAFGPHFADPRVGAVRSEEHTSELQSRVDLVCR